MAPLCQDRPVVMRRLLGPLRSGRTYRRVLHLLLGAVVLLPYVALVWIFAVSVPQLGTAEIVALAVPAVAIGIGVAFVPGVRTLEIAAARALLDVELSDPGPDTWPARRRAAMWLVLVAAIGGVAALLALLAVPWAAGLVLAPWVVFPPFPTGVAASWAPFAGVLLLVVLVEVLAGSGAGLARLAPALLGPSPAQRLAAELERAQRAERTAAERNRLARELHDSIGHALTVTTLQAGAAARVLDTDPAFVARALDAIADTGRTALDELDHVLGLLRDGDAAARTPQPDLRDLDALLDGARTAGVVVTADVGGVPSAVPPAVSREAYRIVQEGLTNALRHAGPVPVAVRVDVGERVVELELSNPLTAVRGRAGGRRGLAGMRERVMVLRGELDAGADSGVWRVRARLPLAP